LSRCEQLKVCLLLLALFYSTIGARLKNGEVLVTFCTIKDKNLKVYNDVQGRLYIYHTTKTAKIKESNILL